MDMPDKIAVLTAKLEMANDELAALREQVAWLRAFVEDFSKLDIWNTPEPIRHLQRWQEKAALLASMSLTGGVSTPMMCVECGKLTTDRSPAGVPSCYEHEINANLPTDTE